MEKENVILTDDELKDVSGGGSGDNEKGCNQFNRKEICAKYNRICYWNIVLKRCVAK